MRLFLSGLILLILSGCFALSREQYEAVDALESNFRALDDRDRKLSHALSTMHKGHQSIPSQEHFNEK